VSDCALDATKALDRRGAINGDDNGDDNGDIAGIADCDVTLS